MILQYFKTDIIIRKTILQRWKTQKFMTVLGWSQKEYRPTQSHIRWNSFHFSYLANYQWVSRSCCTYTACSSTPCTYDISVFTPMENINWISIGADHNLGDLSMHTHILSHSLWITDTTKNPYELCWNKHTDLQTHVRAFHWTWIE